MSLEPEHPMEKALRACAQKRRDEAGAPFELHPANRRLLQGEVKQRFVKSRPNTDSFSAMLARWWPRLAWSVASIAILVVTVWVLLPASDNHTWKGGLAKNETGVREPSQLD